MPETNSTNDLRARVRRATLGLLAACAVLVALASTASAQSGRPGPGPFSNVRVTEKGILFSVANGSTATPFSGAPSISATRGAAEWTPFDERAVVKQSGAQLLQRGSVGGASIDEFFPDGQQRRLLVRNGDGRTTELDVVRFNDLLYVLTTNRSPNGFVKATRRTVTRDLDALEDASVTLNLPKASAKSSLDVVVGVTLAAPPEGVNGQLPQLVATDTADGTVYYGRVLYYANASVTFHHFTIPEGSYTLELINSVSLGNPLASTTIVRLDYPNAMSTTVSKTNRLFGLSVPAPELPEFVDATITVGGLEGFNPTFSNRLDFNLLLVSSGGQVVLHAQRDLGDPSPVAVSVALPAGEYAVSVDVGHDDGDPNGGGYSGGFSFGTHTLPGDVAVSIPPVVRLTGTVLDPGFALASDPDPNSGTTPYHFVSVTEATSPNTFGATATMRGFVRSYAVYVPQGSSVRIGATLTVVLGRPVSGFTPSENDTGRLILTAPGEPLTCDAGCDADLTVPDLPRYVTISGKVLDARGKPAARTIIAALLHGLPSAEDSSFLTSVLTNGDGEFRLRLLRGRGYQLVAFPL